MSEDSSNPNIEWKKKNSFDNKERLSLRVDVQKALKQEASDKKNIVTNNVLRPSDLPKGLKKIRKKIKDIYDDDDEDENDYILPPDFHNSLLNALHEDEKQFLHQQNTLKTMNEQQNAGKAAGIMAADRISRDLGLKGIDKKTINKNMFDIALSSESFENALRDDLSAKAKIKGRKLSPKETVALLRGIKKIQNLAEASDASKTKVLEGWKLDELIDAGRKNADEEKIAEKILEKSGRKKDHKSVKKMAQRVKTQKKSSEKNSSKVLDFYQR